MAFDTFEMFCEHMVEFHNQDASIKKEPSEPLTIKEEPILGCNDCGICDSCTTIHGLVMSIN